MCLNSLWRFDRESPSLGSSEHGNFPPPSVLKRGVRQDLHENPSKKFQHETDCDSRTITFAGFDELNVHLNNNANNNANDHKQHLCCISFIFTPNYGGLKEFTDCLHFLIGVTLCYSHYEI